MAATTKKRAASTATKKAAEVIEPVDTNLTHPSRRPDIEKWLDDKKVPWRFELVPLSQFDVEQSLHNQARVDAPLNKEKAAEYALAMQRAGLDDFPALIASPAPSKKLVIIDGNHRLNGAIESGVAKSIGTYIVTAPPEVITVLTFEANVRNGLPTSVEERLFQAVYLVNGAFKMPMSEAAAVLGLTETQVKSAVAKTKADERARRLGITKGWSSLPVASRRRLSQVITDAGMVAASNVAIHAGLTSGEVEQMVVEMNKLRSDAGQEGVAKEFAKKYKSRVQAKAVGLGSTQKRAFTAFSRFLGVINLIEGLDPNEVGNTSRLAEPDQQAFIDRCMMAAERLMEIAEAAQAGAANS